MLTKEISTSRSLVLLGSQDVNVNSLPVAKETLSERAMISSPWSPQLSVKGLFLWTIFLVLLTSLSLSVLHNQIQRNISKSGALSAGIKA